MRSTKSSSAPRLVRQTVPVLKQEQGTVLGDQRSTAMRQEPWSDRLQEENPNRRVGMDRLLGRQSKAAAVGIDREYPRSREILIAHVV